MTSHTWTESHEQWPENGSRVVADYGHTVRDDVVVSIEFGWSSLTGEILEAPPRWAYY